MVIFFESGRYNVGYSVNRKEEYKLSYEGVNIIGAYAVTFDKRALFIYKTVTQCTGYFIRKINWKNIFANPDFEEITEKLKKNLKNEYVLNIKKPLMQHKITNIKKLAKRADFDTILSLQALNQKL